MRRCVRRHRERGARLVFLAARARLAGVRRRLARRHTVVVVASNHAGGVRADDAALHRSCRRTCARPRNRRNAAMSALVAVILFIALLLGAPLFSVIGAGALLGFQREGTPLLIVPDSFFGLSE